MRVLLLRIFKILTKSYILLLNGMEKKNSPILGSYKFQMFRHDIISFDSNLDVYY